MVSKIYSAALQGLDAMVVTVEVDNFEGGNNPRFTIVGLPDSAVKESQYESMATKCPTSQSWSTWLLLMCARRVQDSTSLWRLA